MSERLVIPDRVDAESELCVDHPWWQFSARFNVAVRQRVPVARIHGRESEGVMMRWGLVPASAKGDVARPGVARLRGNALQSSADFRTAWLYGQRGIVPLAGFYVWQRTRAGHRQPYFVRVDNRAVFGVAVLWERSVTDEDDVVESCALLTVPANPLLAKINPTTDQMPAILRREDYATWLGASVTEAGELLQTYSASRMASHAVAPYVNHLQFDEPQLIYPAAQDPAH
ncbi:MAG: SOS response-associated peptidase family protein [Steroidobacteraceae bacterium]